MLRLVVLLLGFALGFAIVVFAVAAVVFGVVGVGGHLLARSGNGYSMVISFDPSTVAARAPYFAGIAIGLVIVFVIIARRLPKRSRGSH